MSALSVFPNEGGVPRVAANPIYVTSRDGDALTFEVLTVDASILKTLVGRKELYGYEGRVFWGELVRLDACESTADALSLMRDRPAMRGVLKVYAKWDHALTDDKLSKQEIHAGLSITENVDQLLHDLMSIAKDHLADVNQDLAPNIEEKQGKGTLIFGSGDRTEVVFVLGVWSGITGESARSSPPRIERQYRIWIKALGGKQVADGQYELHTNDEILTVSKRGDAWKVLTEG